MLASAWRRNAAAPRPGAGIRGAALASTIVPKIDSVPSRLSILDEPRLVRPVARRVRLDLPQSPSPGRRKGSLLTGMPGDVGDHGAVGQEEARRHRGPGRGKAASGGGAPGRRQRLAGDPRQPGP
jgi:hypothetical protein